MLEKLRVIFTIPELRKKIFLTLGLLAIFRAGYHIPLPMLNQSLAAERHASSGGVWDSMLSQMAALSASDLKNATVFGLGIMPYISASIILQLLATVWRPLEELRKEGESGRKKINEYTRYLTVVLCLFQSLFYVRTHFQVASSGETMVDPNFQNASHGLSIWWQLVAVMIMTAGTVFLMWLGEQIDEYGIGNGISLLIMAGILARMPAAFVELYQTTSSKLGGGGDKGPETVVVLIALFVAVVMGVVFITLGQRRIPTQSAKHVRGRRQFGGNKQHLPLKLNQSGVMPIIFASSLLIVPTFLLNAMGNFVSWAYSGDKGSGSAWAHTLQSWGSMFMSGNSFLHNFLYVLLIYFFCYFWTAIIFNPKEMAENLKDMGTFIPGYRPGRWTADYLEKVMLRITYVGAGFLALVAVIPTLVSSSLGVSFQVASFYGGTGLLIAVSVAFDLVQKVDSHLVMRDYKGLLQD